MSNRSCPECKNFMIEENHNGVRIDKCTSCKGVFLDFGEIKEIVEKVKLEEIFTGVQKGDFKRDNVGKNITCANCTEVMDEREYVYGSGNHVNFCTNCGGIYLDEGELKQVQDFEVSRVSSEEGKRLLKGLQLKGENISDSQNRISSKTSMIYGLFNNIFRK